MYITFPAGDYDWRQKNIFKYNSMFKYEEKNLIEKFYYFNWLNVSKIKILLNLFHITWSINKFKDFNSVFQS